MLFFDTHEVTAVDNKTSRISIKNRTQIICCKTKLNSKVFVRKLTEDIMELYLLFSYCRGVQHKPKGYIFTLKLPSNLIPRGETEKRLMVFIHFSFAFGTY